MFLKLSRVELWWETFKGNALVQPDTGVDAPLVQEGLVISTVDADISERCFLLEIGASPKTLLRHAVPQGEGARFGRGSHVLEASCRPSLSYLLCCRMLEPHTAGSSLNLLES